MYKSYKASDYQIEKIQSIISLPSAIVKDFQKNLKNHPPKFKINDSLAYFFLNLVALRGFEDPDSNELFEGFVPLYSGILKSYSRDYKMYFDYFVETGLLEKLNYSTAKKRSNAYKFASDRIDVNNDFLRVNLHKLAKSSKFKIVEQFDGRDINCEHLVPLFYNGLSIDFDNAIKEIMKEQNFHKRNAQLLAIEKIRNKEFWFKRNVLSDNRLHTPLTNLSKLTRQFFYINGESMVNIDIKCSQPYFLVGMIDEIKREETERNATNTLMLHNIDEIRHIVDLISFKEEYSKIKDWILYDDFYTRMSDSLFEGKEISLERTEIIGKKKNAKCKKVIYRNVRDLVKKLVLRMFYINPDCRVYKGDKDIKLFTEKFPEFSKLLVALKKQDYKKFSMMMQQREAYCILDVVTKRLAQSYPDMPLVTIHDSIATTVSWAKRLNLGELIQTMMFEENGVRPQISVEAWNNVELTAEGKADIF